MFQNPQDESAPFLVDLTVPKDSDGLELESPYFTQVQNGARYGVAIKIYADMQRTVLLGEHAQAIVFS